MHVKSSEHKIFSVLSILLVVGTLSNLMFEAMSRESRDRDWHAVGYVGRENTFGGRSVPNRFAFFKAMRDLIPAEATVRIPRAWAGSDQERMYSKYFRPYLVGFSNFERIIPSEFSEGSLETFLLYEPEEDLQSLRLEVVTGRARPTGSQPRYQWRVIFGPSPSGKSISDDFTLITDTSISEGDFYFAIVETEILVSLATGAEK